MGGKMRGIIMAGLGVIFAIVILAGLLPTLETEATAISDNSSWPTIIQTMFEFWWIPVAIIMIGVISAPYMRRRRRGRRRRG